MNNLHNTDYRFSFFGAQRYEHIFKYKFGTSIKQFNIYSKLCDFDRYEAISYDDQTFTGYILTDEYGMLTDIVPDEIIEKMEQELERRR